MAQYELVTHNDEIFVWYGDLEDVLEKVHPRHTSDRKDAHLFEARIESRQLFLEMPSGNLINFKEVKWINLL